MKKFIMIISTAFVAFLMGCSDPELAPSSSVQSDASMRLNEAKNAYEIARNVYEHLSTNSTSKVEIENARKALQQLSQNLQNAEKEFKLLQKWGMAKFNDADLNAMAKHRFEKGWDMHQSKLLSSSDEAFNISVARGVAAETNTTELCKMTTRILEQR